MKLESIQHRLQTSSLQQKDVDPDFAIYNGDDVMLLPTIVQELWDLCLVEHRFLDMKFGAILMRLSW